MAMNVQRESAKIYQFPLQPRRRPEDPRSAPKAAFDLAGVSVVDSCWYHDEAVRSETATPERPKPC